MHLATHLPVVVLGSGSNSYNICSFHTMVLVLYLVYYCHNGTQPTRVLWATLPLMRGVRIVNKMFDILFLTSWSDEGCLNIDS